MVVTGCQENESCGKVLNFLERLDDIIRCTTELGVIKGSDLAIKTTTGNNEFNTINTIIILTVAGEWGC